jgi:2-aminoadipate transaminase
MQVKARPEPVRSAAVRRVGSSAIRDLLAVAERPDVISLAGGLPNAERFPAEVLAEAAATVLADDPAGALQYAATSGYEPLRTWVAARHRVDPSQVVVTHGSQQALELVVRALVDPGDTIALADPGYVGALQAFRLAGADLLGIPSDRGGLRVDVLADRLAAGARPVLVYVVANLDNPTGATLSAERRVLLSELADRHGFWIVDDDPYGDLRFPGRPAPPAPLATLGDRVVTLGSTSKVLAPGLRVGWAVGPEPLLRDLVLLKQAVDLQTATLAQRLAHHVLVRPGFLEPHLAGLRSAYQEQAEALTSGLQAALGDRISFEQPTGGMFVWAQLGGLDTRKLLPVAIEHGTAFVPGAEFAVDPVPTSAALRLSFATATPEDLHEATRRLAAAVRSVG